MSSKDEITVRRATHGDCDTIKAIDRNIYDGADFFTYSFHERVSSTSAFPYVAEIAGKIVGYTCGRVIDDGEAIVMEAARVSPDLYGRRIINKVNQGLLMAAKRMFPKLKKMLWASGNEARSTESMAKRPFIKHIETKTNVEFGASSADLKVLCEAKRFRELEEKYQVDTITAIPKREALRLLEEEIQFLPFAPNTLTIGWEPCGWYKSTLAEQLQITNLHISRCQKTGKILAFSFDTLGRVDLGRRIWVDVYAEKDSNVDLVLAHLFYHLKETAVLQNNKHIEWSFHFPEKIERQLVQMYIDYLGLPPKDYTHHKSRLLAGDIESILALKSSL